MDIGDRRQRIWDAVYSAVFAKRWSDDMRPAEKGEYNKAVDEANSAAVNAANEAIKWLDLGNTLKRAPKPE
jgi:hypothetical protein